MNFLQSIILYFISPLISLLILLIFVSVIMSWLVSFGVVNLRNPTMAQIYSAIEMIVRPILDPIRRVVPAFGGLDFSPIIALLLLSWIQGYLLPSLAMAVG